MQFKYIAMFVHACQRKNEFAMIKKNEHVHEQKRCEHMKHSSAQTPSMRERQTE